MAMISERAPVWANLVDFSEETECQRKREKDGARHLIQKKSKRVHNSEVKTSEVKQVEEGRGEEQREANSEDDNEQGGGGEEHGEDNAEKLIQDGRAMANITKNNMSGCRRKKLRISCGRFQYMECCSGEDHQYYNGRWGKHDWRQVQGCSMFSGWKDCAIECGKNLMVPPWKGSWQQAQATVDGFLTKDGQPKVVNNWGGAWLEVLITKCGGAYD